MPPTETRRILQRLEWHYTPKKHTSWLNMVEIEIGVLRRKCLARRIESRDRLVAEVQAWEQLRNASGTRIAWMFCTDKAKQTLTKTYTVPIADKAS